MLKIEKLSYKIKNKLILDNISFVINDGEIVALIGSNGSGKSTLLRILARAIKTNKLNKYEKNIFYLPDNFNLPRNLYSRDFLINISRIFNKTYDIDEILRFLSIPNQKIGSLSKGNKQKLSICIGFISNANILLYDEILDGLDQETIKKIIIILKKTNKTVIFVTHYIKLFKYQKIRIIRLEEGKIVS